MKTLLLVSFFSAVAMGQTLSPWEMREQYAASLQKQYEQNMARQQQESNQQTDYKCLNECQKRGYQYGFCQKRCSY